MEIFAAVPAAIGRSLPQILADTGRFGMGILAIMFVMSVITWAVVFDRARLYKKLRQRGESLRRAIGSRGAAACIHESEKYQPSIEAAMLLEAKRFVASRGGDTQLAYDDPAEAESERSHLRALMEGRATSEIGEMERHLILLSTTASGAPFLGLLGTCWGIMHSFMSMAGEGAASLDVVGPGIAEALVATIAGLATAIPALFAYNIFVRAVRRKETQVDLFVARVTDGVITTRAGAQRSGQPAPRTQRAPATAWPGTPATP